MQNKGLEEKTWPGGSPSAPPWDTLSKRGSCALLVSVQEVSVAPLSPQRMAHPLFSNKRNKATLGHKDSLPLINTSRVLRRHIPQAPGDAHFGVFSTFGQCTVTLDSPPEGWLCGEHLLTMS